MRLHRERVSYAPSPGVILLPGWPASGDVLVFVNGVLEPQQYAGEPPQLHSAALPSDVIELVYLAELTV
jgi:hypothetical protein